ncbi:MAG: RNA polymerase sigma factor [Planctomycetaceae bacterium]
MESISTSPSLLDGIREGRDDAWARFVHLYGPSVYSKCRSRGCEDTDARDISQEVFLRLHKSIGTFNPDGREKSFTRWLSTVVKRVVIDHYRKVAKTPKATGGTAFLGMIENHPDQLEESLSFSGESDKTLIVRRALKMVQQDVTEQSWQAFKQHGIEGLPAPEVAAELGMKADAVRKAKSRVMARLREILDGLLD